MEENPYSAFAVMMGGEGGGAGLTMGKVTAAGPLKVLVDGNTMEQGELLCNPALLGRGKAVSGKLDGSGSVGNVSGDVSITVEGTLRRTAPDWTVGEQLLMLPIEEAQRYVIICKVVEL